MATLDDCLTAAIETGQLSDIEAAQIKDMASSERFYQNGKPDDAARAAAERKAIDEYFAEKELNKRQRYLQVEAMQKNIKRMESHPEGAYTGLMSLLVNDITRQAKYNNVDVQAKVLTGRYRAQIAELMEAYRPKNAGFSQDTEAPRRMLLEALGVNTGDADAKRFAAMWAEVAEDARQLFNAAGGAIRKRNDWGMKQTHDLARVGARTYEQWRDDILPLLDINKMSEQTLNKIRAEIQQEIAVSTPITDSIAKANKALAGMRKQRSQAVIKAEGKLEMESQKLDQTLSMYADRLDAANEEYAAALKMVEAQRDRVDGIFSPEKRAAAEARLRAAETKLSQREAKLQRADQNLQNKTKDIEIEKQRLAQRVEDLQNKQLTQEGIKLKERLDAMREKLGESRDKMSELEFRHRKLSERIDTEEIDIELKETYNRIVSGGLSDIDSTGGIVNPAKVANRHQQSRELIFTDGHAYLKYHDMYGKGDIYGNMLQHLDQMAHETALMEVMGPNPMMQFDALKQAAQISEYKKTGQVPSKHKEWVLNNVWHVVSGEVNDVVSEGFANLMTGIRSQLVAAQLGAATLSALTDLALTKIISQLNGVSAMKVAMRSLKQLNPKNKADRLAAAKMGLMADAWTATASGGSRFAEVTGAAEGGAKPKYGAYILQKYADSMAKVADITMRASLLTPWEQSARNAFGMEFMGALGDVAGKSFDELPKQLKKSFGVYAINKQDWQKMRQVNLTEIDGVKFLRPNDLVALKGSSVENNRLVAKFQRMIIQETDYAIPRPDARVRGLLMQNSRKGTFVGELMRSATMYKSFPVTLMSMHMFRMFAEKGTDKLAYMANMFVGMSLMGALAYQAKEISKGREPLDMTGDNAGKFWAAAIMQGGGLGLLGDLFFADQNRYGGGIGSTLGGPSAALFDDAAKITVGTVQKLVAGEDAKLGANILQFSKRYTPGSSLWYGRLAFERAVWDNIQKEVDPEAQIKFNRLVRKRRADQNQEYWWAPQ